MAKDWIQPVFKAWVLQDQILLCLPVMQPLGLLALRGVQKVEKDIDAQTANVNVKWMYLRDARAFLS